MSIGFRPIGVAPVGASPQDTEPEGALSAAEMRQMFVWINDLARIHGLVASEPLVVTPTTRSAGSLVQSISEVSTTVTVTRS